MPSRDEGTGRREGRDNRRHTGSGKVPAAGRGRGHRAQYWAAIKGREALKPTWDDGPNRFYHSAAFKAQIEETARRPGKVVRNDGDVEKALAFAGQGSRAEYYIPHLAHATMEPPSATVRIADGKCEVWACVQSPQGTRDERRQEARHSADNVTVHVTLLGGGFGRKSKMRLRAGSGGAVARYGRHSGQGDLDA